MTVLASSQVIEADELVKLAMERIGSERPSDLARALRLEGYTSPRRVKRWLLGENEPDYSATLGLLGLVGALNEEALRPVPDEIRQRAEELQERSRRARAGLRKEASG